LTAAALERFATDECLFADGSAINEMSASPFDASATSFEIVRPVAITVRRISSTRR